MIPNKENELKATLHVNVAFKLQTIYREAITLFAVYMRRLNEDSWYGAQEEDEEITGEQEEDYQARIEIATSWEQNSNEYKIAESLTKEQGRQITAAYLLQQQYLAERNVGQWVPLAQFEKSTDEEDDASDLCLAAQKEILAVLTPLFEKAVEEYRANKE